MDIGGLLERSWNVVWNNKFLVILGVIIAIGSGGGGGGGGSSNYSTDFSDPNNPFTEFAEDGEFTEEDFEQLAETFAPEIVPLIAGIGALLIVILCVAVIIGIILWILGIIARGGLIAGVAEIESEGASSFGKAWQAGMGKFMPLLGIGLIEAIPVLLILFAMIAAVFGMVSSIDVNAPESFFGVFAVVGSLCCLLLVISFVMGLLKEMAFRACVLEDAGVFEAYGRGFEILKDNVGQVALLILIQFGIGLVSAIVIVPLSFIAGICCILLPVIWVVQGSFVTYYSTMWTLAWRDWTGAAGTGEPIVIEQAPAV